MFIIKGLDKNILNNKKSKIVSSKEALKDVEPINWNEYSMYDFLNDVFNQWINLSKKEQKEFCKNIVNSMNSDECIKLIEIFNKNNVK